jgi:hypothetical protein
VFVFGANGRFVYNRVASSMALNVEPARRVRASWCFGSSGDYLETLTQESSELLADSPGIDQKRFRNLSIWSKLHTARMNTSK